MFGVEIPNAQTYNHTHTHTNTQPHTHTRSLMVVPLYIGLNGPNRVLAKVIRALFWCL